MGLPRATVELESILIGRTCLTLVAGFVIGLSSLESVLAQGAARPVPSTPPPIRSTIPPEERILVQAWAETETVISSPIVGQVLQMPTRPGTRFAKDEVLIRYECTENEARSQIAESELTAASEGLEAKLRLKGMNAASEIEVTTAAAQVAKAQAQLRLTRHQVSQCRIIAPFDGFVVRVMGKPFQTATVGQPLIEIITAGTPRLRVSADSRLFTRIQVGTPLLITIDETGLSYAAQVSMVNARIDPVNQSFEMEARIVGQSQGLLPGMSGSATIVPAAAATGAVLPASAATNTVAGAQPAPAGASPGSAAAAPPPARKR